MKGLILAIVPNAGNTFSTAIVLSISSKEFSDIAHDSSVGIGRKMSAPSVFLGKLPTFNPLCCHFEYPLHFFSSGRLDDVLII